MKVRLNEDRQVVDAIREGLKRTGGYWPVPPGPDGRKTAACARSSKTRSQTPTLRGTATAVCIIRRSKACPPVHIEPGDFFARRRSASCRYNSSK